MVKRIIALGFFDGLHRGHATLMERAKQRAAELGASPAVMTFDTHPDELVTGVKVPLITSPSERAHELRRLFGIDEMISLRFDKSMMNMPWEEFVSWLTENFDATGYVVGEDFCFGRGGKGTAELLEAWCAERGLTCDVMPQLLIDGVVVSSTYIRQLLLDGETEKAARFLGHPAELTGDVLYGYRLGSKMGTPTINMRYPDGVLIPRHGVYATRVHIEEDPTVYRAVTNIGVRPTVSGDGVVSVESYILDFSRNIYGYRVRLEFMAFIRPERKFSGIDELKAQILADAEKVRNLEY
ncbi:MAG: bifunctional riboflavin kinase/FAD synthetase [Oscillospiraceae bacterium]|nr:bifunctional riboflavin kinase/FAD synthetase [Oscillospiraceae bacterium]